MFNVLLIAVPSWFVQRASLIVNIDLSDITKIYYTVLYRTVVVYEKKIDHWCSVVPEKSQPSGPPFSGNSASINSHWNDGPSGWDFSVPTEHQWWFLFFWQPANKGITQSCTRWYVRKKNLSLVITYCHH